MRHPRVQRHERAQLGKELREQLLIAAKPSHHVAADFKDDARRMARRWRYALPSLVERFFQVIARVAFQIWVPVTRTLRELVNATVDLPEKCARRKRPCLRGFARELIVTISSV